jgi:MOSC domain-containing protein YiiM
VERVEVDLGGAAGDRQASRQHHGRPWQALCLWSMEVIDDLRADGHPIDAGSAGENLTVRGIDWAGIRTGVQVQVGEVVCEVSAPTLPCSKNRQWFRDGDWNHMHHDRGPVSRAYATVLRPGTIAVGDDVTLLP